MNIQDPQLQVFPFLNQVIISYSYQRNENPFFPAPSHPQEVILIVNKREDASKTQQTPGSIDETPKISTGLISPKPIRQRERSGVESDDDELIAQIQKLIDSNSGIGEEELLKEKILEARLIAQCKYLSFSINDRFLFPSKNDL